MTSEVKKDWKADFYKNGIPKEVIVIEDTPPPSTTNTPSIPNTSYRVEQPNTDYPVGPPATSTRSKRTRKEQEQEDVNQILSIVKRRKKDVPLLTQQLQASTSSVLRRPNNTIPTPLAVPLPPVPCDDKDGHYIIKPNESLTPRCMNIFSLDKMMRLLGQGTFGKVVECYDRVKRTYCAIKIIRAIPKYRDASQSVFDFLKFNEFRPFPIHHIQQFAKQILTSVAFVHELKLIHTDLKPENILLVDNRSREAGNIVDIDPTSKILENTDIRLIDFGSATFERDYHSSVVSTRHYRAPEIILGMGWSYPCDIWSIGCILVEFLTGEALFQTHDNLEHLAMMVVVLGKIPSKLVKASSREAQKFFKNGKLKYPDVDTTEQSKKYVRALKLLKRIVNPTTNAKYQFLDLLTKMLVYDPDARITAREALRHPFFMINFDEFGREIEEY
ncbi:kinase-like domain-containing protein [Choanephora cucurbitarum]|nr:kinase-like domain-containing protein [Choanephora cucurbitarum]